MTTKYDPVEYDAADFDNICNYGELFGEPRHITAGPDSGTPYDPAKLERDANGDESYNGHPVSHAACKRHAGMVATTSSRYAARKYRRNIPGSGGQPS